MGVKGHTKVELFDGLTGRLTERVESDNMFTNAIPKMVNFALTHPYHGTGSGGGLNNWYTNHLALVNGLFLFDQAITEDADMLYAPSGAKLTGVARVNVSNNNPSARQLGTYNASESSTANETSKTWVWDFATDQGNGQIACLALTHTNGAGGYAYGIDPNSNNGLGVSTSTMQYSRINLGEVLVRPNVPTVRRSVYYCGTKNDNYVSFCVDSDTDLIYMFNINTDGLKLVSYKMKLARFNIFQSGISSQPYTEETIAFDFSSTPTYFYHFYNTDEQVLYFWFNGSSSLASYGNNASVQIYKLDMRTKTISVHGTFVNGSGASIYAALVVTQSAVYTKEYKETSNSTFRVFKSEFQGAQTTTIYTSPTVGYTYCYYQNIHNMSYVFNGIVHMSGRLGFYTGGSQSSAAFRAIVIHTTDDDVRINALPLDDYLTNDTYSNHMQCIPPMTSTQMIFAAGIEQGGYFSNQSVINLENSGNVYGNVWTPVHYLATINNLPETLTKTADKTMKVSYTISLVED